MFPSAGYTTPLRRHEGSGTSLDSVILPRIQSNAELREILRDINDKIRLRFLDRANAKQRVVCAVFQEKYAWRWIAAGFGHIAMFWIGRDAINYAVLIVNLSIAPIQKREAGVRRSCIVSVTARFNFVLGAAGWRPRTYPK